MKKKKGRKLIAYLLAAIMVVQMSVPLNAIASQGAEGINEQQSTEKVTDEATKQAERVLLDGTAMINTTDDEATVKAKLGNALIKNPEEEDLQGIKWEYYCAGKSTSGLSSNKGWGSVNGFKTTTGFVWTTTYNHPALAKNKDGAYKVRIAGTTKEVEFTKVSQAVSSIELNDGVQVELIYNDDYTMDYGQFKQVIFDKLVKSSSPKLSVDDVNMEYYATAKTGSVGTLGKAWIGLEGGKKAGLEYPGIAAGEQKIRISAGGITAEGVVKVKGLKDAKIELKKAPYQVDMAFNKDASYNIEATREAIYKAVIKSIDPLLTKEEIKIEYEKYSNRFEPLTNKDNNFKPGEWKIRFSWDGARTHTPGSVEVTVQVTDNRGESLVVLKKDPSFTYNADANVMKKEILDKVIDWEKSKLPARENLSIDNFEMKYYADSYLNTSGIKGLKGWSKIEGEPGLFSSYRIMGAGEQNVKLVFVGNDTMKKSETVSGTVKVTKARVGVKVRFTNIFPEEAVPKDMVTTSVKDDFDIYTVYAGITRNVTTGVYIDLPDRYENSAIIGLIDPVIKAIFNKSIKDILNNGITLKELRELLGSKQMLSLLKTFNLDKGTVGQIIKVVNNLPHITDSMRISFGTPNRAGGYAVTSVVTSPNYNTGIGVGAILVKPHYKGVKLSWNQEIPRNRMTTKQAKEFDFGANLSYEGNKTASQESVKYLYSGFTSKWRIYSSTTTPPTEPGRYIVTVVTLGGDYQAMPITRTFKITK
ncbi:MAG: hypothetical protein RSE61_07240 [Anaerovoracaceae bacterium]